MRPIIVAVRLSLPEKRLLVKAAKRMGCPVSDAIRWALRRELSAPKGKKAEVERHQSEPGK
jgi:hypothetical protein